MHSSGIHLFKSIPFELEKQESVNYVCSMVLKGLKGYNCESGMEQHLQIKDQLTRNLNLCYRL